MTTHQERLVDIFKHDAAVSEDSNQPFRLGSRLWATNGQILVVLDDDGTPATDTPERWAKAKPLIEGPVLNPRQVSLSALRQFVGKLDTHRGDCDACFGVGYDGMDTTECEHCHAETRLVCNACGGDGRGVIVQRHGRIDGSRFNLNLVAYGLVFLPDEPTAIMGRLPAAKSSRWQNDGPVVIEVGTARCVVMPMTPSDEVMPVFSVDAPVAVPQAHD
jgi:hypothetical protein